jgi:hypothetical protein
VDAGNESGCGACGMASLAHHEAAKVCKIKGSNLEFQTRRLYPSADDTSEALNCGKQGWQSFLAPSPQTTTAGIEEPTSPVAT